MTNVKMHFEITGAVTFSTVSGCDPVTLSADGVTTLNCRASGPGGDAASKPIFKIDKTPPTAVGAADRGANGNGWFNSPVGVTFSGSDATSGIAGCTQASYAGPDSASAVLNGTCRDVAGNVTTASFGLKYDATAPSVNANPERTPDANGWYNHAVTVSFGGSDAASGIDSCTGSKYEGPDTAGTAVGGSCTDKAGNSASTSFQLKYDATPPKVTDVSVTPGNKRVLLHWKASPDTAAVTVTRVAVKKGAAGKVVYRGTGGSVADNKLTNGLRYRYTVTGVDEAGNAASASTAAVPRALSSPAEGARLHGPPLLAWAPAPKAAYYNVQLFRGKEKVLSIWPHSTKLKLPRTWAYAGRHYRLSPGRYRWYVWPGYGSRAQSRYGSLLGGSFFFIVR